MSRSPTSRRRPGSPPSGRPSRRRPARPRATRRGAATSPRGSTGSAGSSSSATRRRARSPGPARASATSACASARRPGRSATSAWKPCGRSTPPSSAALEERLRRAQQAASPGAGAGLAAGRPNGDLGGSHDPRRPVRTEDGERRQHRARDDRRARRRARPQGARGRGARPGDGRPRSSRRWPIWRPSCRPSWPRSRPGPSRSGSRPWRSDRRRADVRVRLCALAWTPHWRDAAGAADARLDVSPALVDRPSPRGGPREAAPTPPEKKRRRMRSRFAMALLALLVSVGLVVTLSMAAAPKQYQWTGTVTEVDAKDKTMSVDKAGEVWQFSTEGLKDAQGEEGRQGHGLLRGGREEGRDEVGPRATAAPTAAARGTSSCRRRGITSARASSGRRRPRRPGGPR